MTIASSCLSSKTAYDDIGLDQRLDQRGFPSRFRERASKSQPSHVLNPGCKIKQIGLAVMNCHSVSQPATPCRSTSIASTAFELQRQLSTPDRLTIVLTIWLCTITPVSRAAHRPAPASVHPGCRSGRHSYPRFSAQSSRSPAGTGPQQTGPGGPTDSCAIELMLKVLQ
jgi:hypothetical protein